MKSENKHSTIRIDLQLDEDTLIKNGTQIAYKAGAICPTCKKALLDYDGLLNLVCPNCGAIQGGCFT